MAKKYDDLIAEAVNLGLSEDRDLNKVSESELKELIKTTKLSKKTKEPPKIQKHDFWRG